MELIHREELQEKMQRGDDFALVEVLDEEVFRKKHLPGALNVPVNEENFAERIRTVVPDTSREVVLYCWDSECPLAGKAARIMEAEGYGNVKRYPEGKKDWLNARLESESGGEKAA